MSKNSATRAAISAIVGDIEKADDALRAQGIDARDPSDREAFDIISRIERKLAAAVSHQGAK